MPSHESAIVTAAKRLARAQEKRRKARKAMREIEAEIKLARKFLRASMVSALNVPDEISGPAYCEIHQHYKWCEHNGGIRGASGFEAPPSNQLPPRNGRQIRRRQK